MKKLKYDFYIRNISDDPKDPAYEAYIPSIDTTVFGSSFKELEEGIKFSFKCEKAVRIKKVPKLAFTMQKVELTGETKRSNIGVHKKGK